MPIGVVTVASLLLLFFACVQRVVITVRTVRFDSLLTLDLSLHNGICMIVIIFDGSDACQCSASPVIDTATSFETRQYAGKKYEIHMKSSNHRCIGNCTAFSTMDDGRWILVIVAGVIIMLAMQLFMS